MVDINTSKTVLEDKFLAFPLQEAKDSLQYTIRSNKDILKVDSNTNRTVVGDMSLQFLAIKAKGKCPSKNHSNRDIDLVDKDTNKIVWDMMDPFLGLLKQEAMDKSWYSFHSSTWIH